MIMVVTETSDTAIVHMIVGIQTHLFLDFMGEINIIMTPLIERFKDKSLMLKMTQCHDEEATLAYIKSMGIQACRYGESTGVNTLTGNGLVQKTNSPDQVSSVCAFCFGATAVPGTNPPECETCKTIRLGLGKQHEK